MKKLTPPEDEGMNDLLKRKELSVAQAAKVLDLSRQTVYKLIDEQALLVSRRKTATMGIFVSTSSIIKYIRDVQLRDIRSSN